MKKQQKLLFSLALLVFFSISTTACTELMESLDTNYAEPAIISKHEARQIALHHSGVKPNRATFNEVHYEDRQNGGVYKVKFHTPNRIFNYTINARNGNVKNYNIRKR